MSNHRRLTRLWWKHAYPVMVTQLNRYEYSDFGRVRRHSFLYQFRASLLPRLHQLSHKAIIFCLVPLMIPLFIVAFNKTSAIQVEGDF